VILSLFTDLINCTYVSCFPMIITMVLLGFNCTGVLTLCNNARCLLSWSIRFLQKLEDPILCLLLLFLIKSVCHLIKLACWKNVYKKVTLPIFLNKKCSHILWTQRDMPSPCVFVVVIMGTAVDSTALVCYPWLVCADGVFSCTIYCFDALCSKIIISCTR
jgi:hypothetical protein